MFVRGDHQVYRSIVGEADKVEVRFRGLKENQGKREGNISEEQ